MVCEASHSQPLHLGVNGYFWWSKQQESATLCFKMKLQILSHASPSLQIKTRMSDTKQINLLSIYIQQIIVVIQMSRKQDLKNILNGFKNYTKTLKHIYHIDQCPIQLSTIPESVSTYISEAPSKNLGGEPKQGFSARMALALFGFVLLSLIVLRMINFFSEKGRAEDMILWNFNEATLDGWKDYRQTNS